MSHLRPYILAWGSNVHGELGIGKAVLQARPWLESKHSTPLLSKV